LIYSILRKKYDYINKHFSPYSKALALCFFAPPGNFLGCISHNNFIELFHIIGNGTGVVAGGIKTLHNHPFKNLIISAATKGAVGVTAPGAAPLVNIAVKTAVNNPGVAGPPGAGKIGGMAEGGATKVKVVAKHKAVKPVSKACAAYAAVWDKSGSEMRPNPGYDVCKITFVWLAG
jgi:hypothetical protein